MDAGSAPSAAHARGEASHPYLDRSIVGRIVPGRTTRAEVLAPLGAPDEFLRQFDGDRFAWRRVGSSRRSLTLLPVCVEAAYFADSRSRREDQSLLFHADGILRGIGVRLGTGE